MILDNGAPEFVLFDAANKAETLGSEKNWGYRVITENPDYNISPEQAGIRTTSILAIYTYVSNWIEKDYKEYKEDTPIKCERRQTRKGVIYFSPKGYFPYSCKYIRLQYSKVSKEHNCPTCFCKKSSPEIIHEIILPELTKPTDRLIHHIVKARSFDVEITCYDEAFSVELIYKPLQDIEKVM